MGKQARVRAERAQGLRKTKAERMASRAGLPNYWEQKAQAKEMRKIQRMTFTGFLDPVLEYLLKSK